MYQMSVGVQPVANLEYLILFIRLRLNKSSLI